MERNKPRSLLLDKVGEYFYVSKDSAWQDELSEYDWCIDNYFGIYPRYMDVKDHYIHQWIDIPEIKDDNTEAHVSIKFENNDDHYPVYLQVNYYDKNDMYITQQNIPSLNVEGTLEDVATVPVGTSKIRFNFGNTWRRPEGAVSTSYVHFWDPSIVLSKKVVLGNPVQSVDVTFDPNNGEEPWTKTMTKGEIAEMPVEQSRDGYQFSHWTLNGVEYHFNTPVNEAITLVAQYEKEEDEGNETEVWHVVNLDTHGGSAMRFREVQHGHLLDIGYVPVKEGYRLKYWALAGEQFDFNTPITHDINLDAVWEVLPAGEENSEIFKVKFNADGGDYTPPTQEVEKGKHAYNPLPGYPKKSGAEFIGWYLNGQEFDFENYEVKSNITLIAKYSNADTYLVHFDLRGAKTVRNDYLEAVDVVAGKLVDEIQIPLERGSYVVKGFYTAKGEFNFGTPIVRDTVLYLRMESGQGETYEKQRRKDVVVSDFYYDRAFIDYNGQIFTGYPDNTFRPEENMTRAQVATVFARMLGLENKVPSGNRFSDISNHWAKNNILNIAEYGLINGYPDGTFHPDANMTKAELAALINKYWKAEGFYPHGDYTDIKDTKDHWSRSAVDHLYNHGFVDVLEDRLFNPNQPITREEAALILNRLTDREVGYQDYQMYEDVPMENRYVEEINAAASEGFY